MGCRPSNIRRNEHNGSGLSKQPFGSPYKHEHPGISTIGLRGYIHGLADVSRHVFYFSGQVGFAIGPFLQNPS
jgi:hypothetical protein